MVMIASGALALIAAALWVTFTAIHTEKARRNGPGRLLTFDQPFPAGGRYPGDPYIGSKVCAECHPGESALHARSGHARTLRPAARLELASRLHGSTFVDPELPDVRWSYRLRDGQLELERAAQEEMARWIVDYAFGSGHHATTFVNVLDPAIPAILEHRITYYAAEQTLGITPGQAWDTRSAEWRPHGNELTPRNTRKCFRCHSTQLAARDDVRIDAETMIPNVSCESCHGPGRAHVAAARRGAPESDLALPFGPDRWTSETLLMLCGACHRHPSKAQPGQIRPDNPHLARFQPVGIMQSRCYLKSGGAFSCISCHDPHARATADRASYSSICLSCHEDRGSSADQSIRRTATPADSFRAPGPPCPVSPRRGCVDCHMPRADSGQHILFTDHWIRVRSPGESSQRHAAGPNRDPLDPAEP
jgi:hypothetical protein